MEFAEQERRPEQVALPVYQSFPPEDSEDSPFPPGGGVNYSKVPKAFQQSSVFGIPSAPPQEKAQGQSNGSSAPMRIAQFADSGMDDGFWFKALAAAGLAIYKGGEYIITGSEKAVEDLYRNWSRTHQDTTKPQQVLKASQRGRQGNVGDSGIVGEAQELIAQAKAQGKELKMKDALAQLMKKARQSNNGKGDPAREAKIRATQKAEDARGSRESKDGKKKPKREGRKEDKKDKGNKGNN